MHETKLLRRLCQVNKGKIIKAQIVYSQLQADGHGCVGLSVLGHGKSGYETQVFIHPNVAKAFLAGKPNQNLDAALRL